MNIDKFINRVVSEHNQQCCDITISKTSLGDWSCYFLYMENFDIWGINEWKLYRTIYDRLASERIFPNVRMRVIDGKTKIGIGFEFKRSL